MITDQADIKKLTQAQLESVYMQVSIQTQLNNKMLELLVAELITRQEDEQARKTIEQTERLMKEMREGNKELKTIVKERE